MIVSIITPGAKGGYGGIAKYNTNIIEFFLKKKMLKKLIYFQGVIQNILIKKLIYILQKIKFYFFSKYLCVKLKLFNQPLL